MNQVLEACKKEYQKSFYKTKLSRKKIQELQEELKKYQTKTSVKNNRKISLRDIELDEENLKNYFAARKRGQKRKGGDIMTIMTVLLTKQKARVITVMTALTRKVKADSQLLKRKRTKKT